MLIDWFTVVAQIINFAVLVWLLKRFLYARILRAVETREARIAAALADAAARQEDAAKQLALYESRLRELEQQKETLVTEARRDAANQHAQMLERAREEVRALESKWQADLSREWESFREELRRRVSAEILLLARRLVADLAGVELQQCAVRVFLEKVRTLDHEAWNHLGPGALSIRTAVDLPENTQAEIQLAIEERLQAPVQLRFEHAPELGLGLELRGNGWRIGWNSESYLEALEQDMREALEPELLPGGHARG